MNAADVQRLEHWLEVHEKYLQRDRILMETKHVRAMLAATKAVLSAKTRRAREKQKEPA